MLAAKHRLPELHLPLPGPRNPSLQWTLKPSRGYETGGSAHHGATAASRTSVDHGWAAASPEVLEFEQGTCMFPNSWLLIPKLRCEGGFKNLLRCRLMSMCPWNCSFDALFHSAKSELFTVRMILQRNTMRMILLRGDPALPFRRPRDWLRAQQRW